MTCYVLMGMLNPTRSLTHAHTRDIVACRQQVWERRWSVSSADAVSFLWTVWLPVAATQHHHYQGIIKSAQQFATTD